MGKSVALGCIVLILVGVLVVGGMAAGAYNKLNAADQAVSGAGPRSRTSTSAGPI